MTLVNLINDFIETSKERLKTPISGAFLWSFIVWNWRPLAVLLFSDASIQDKIIVINNEYCDFWAILCPIFLAILYVTLLPKLMLIIDNTLIETKALRVENIYQAKIHSATQKTDLADIEFKLKEIQSGSKQIQDLLDEIESLKAQMETQKESFKQMNEADKSTINQLNKRLKNANLIINKKSENNDRYEFDNLENTVIGDTLDLDEQFRIEVLEVVKNLTFEEFQVLKFINIRDKDAVFFAITKENAGMLKTLSQKKILTYKTSENNYETSLSAIGIIISEIIQYS